MYETINCSLFKESSVNWCEPKYIITPYIAEFWNTITGIPYILLAIYGLSRMQKHPAIWFEIAGIGIGTILFHGGRTLIGQLIDEISIVLFLMTITSSLLNLKNTLLLHVAAAIAMFLYPPYNCHALFIVGLSAAIPLLLIAIMDSHTREQIFHLFVLTVCGISLWLIEKYSCDCSQTSICTYFHAIWHIIMLIVCWWLVHVL